MVDGIYLGLGSNLGDRLGNLALAITHLQQQVGPVLAQSGVYETPPWGNTEQPAFLNQVVHLQSEVDPHALLSALLEIETAMGRLRTVHWGPRVIDVDILSFGGMQIAGQRLTLPHPHLAQRAFVLVPWAEIAADFQVPGLGATVRELLTRLDPREVDAVRRIS